MTAGGGATRKDVAVFVAGGGNGFMTDIAMWLVEAAAATGRAATLVEDRLPDDPHLANLVVAPHELYVLSGADERAVAASCRISIPVCTEQPGTSWFRSSVTLSRPAPFALDINAPGVEALRSQQVAADQACRRVGPSHGGRRPTAGRAVLQEALRIGRDNFGAAPACRLNSARNPCCYRTFFLCFG